MPSTPTTVVAARVSPDHAEQLRQIAIENASSISRTVGRIVAERLDAQQQQTNSQAVIQNA